MYLIATSPGHERIVDRARGALYALGLAKWAHLKGVKTEAAERHKPERRVANGLHWWLWYERDPGDRKEQHDAVAGALRQAEGH